MVVASLRKTANGTNVYAEGDSFEKVRIATMCFYEEAVTLAAAINEERVNFRKLMKRVDFARNGMLPRRVLRIFILEELVFLPGYSENEDKNEE